MVVCSAPHFLLYINDILRHVRHVQPFLFADDIKIAYTFRQESAGHTLINIQSDLDALTHWSALSGLSFSASKCQTLFYRCHSTPCPLILNGQPISNTQEVRDLGLRYSCVLSFSNQMHYQATKAQRLCALIARSFHTTQVKITIYKKIVLPILDYCPIFASYYPQKIVCC